MLKSYSYIFELKDRFSGPIKKIGGGLASANAGLQRWGQRMDTNRAKASRMGKSMLSLRNLLVGSFVTSGISRLGGELVDTLGKFEKMEAVLTNTLGSNSMAKQVIGDISDFASETPFQVDELTDSWVRLANQGFRPNMEQMMSLGDLASSTGKDFTQLSEAVIDAQVGEFERLKEFGIRASKSGDQVAFTFKGQTKEVAFTEKAIQDYLLSLGKMDGVQGSSAAIMETTSGKISNFWDGITRLKLAIGVGLAPQIQGLIEGASGLVQKLTSLVPWVSANYDVFLRWGKIIAWTTGIMGAAWAMAKTILGFQSLYATITTAIELYSAATKGTTIAQWALNLAMTANPIGVLVVGIGVGIAALAALATNFMGFRDMIFNLGKWMWDYNPFKWMIDLIGNVFPSFKSAFDNLFGGIIADFKKVFNWIGGLFDGFKFKDIALNVIPKVSDPNADPYVGTSAISKGGSSTSKRRRNGGIGVNKAVGAAVSGGGGNVKNITINVDALNKGGITVQTSNIGMSTQQLKVELEKMLLSVVNDVNYG